MQCQKCGSDLVPENTSQVDPDFCNECMPLVDITEKPLIDDEGVTHTGRILEMEPTQARTLLRCIADMENAELATYIDHMKAEVKAAEHGLDVKRIALGAAQLEQEERSADMLRKLRGIRIRSNTSRTISSNANGSPAKGTKAGIKAKLTIENLKAAGITKELLEQLIKMKEGKKGA